MKNKKILSLICTFVMFFSFDVPVQANSAAQIWEGRNSSGVIVKEADIPIIVENELLTFDLPTLPYASYRNAESFLAYDSKVTAKYTFCNPTDMTITATLLFPFGDYPSYGAAGIQAELEKYGVYINDGKIDANIRHTANYRYDKFDTDAHIASLSDEFLEDDFYNPDLTITKYSYEIVGQQINSAYFNINIDTVGSERRIVLYNSNLGGYISESGGFAMNSRYNKNEKKNVCFYVFGKPLDTMPDVSWYVTNGLQPDTKIDGEFSYLGSETTTLRDFIFSEYEKKDGIYEVSEVDWYNACITNLKLREESRGTTRVIRSFFFTSLMRWFEYKVTFKPGEKIENTVVAPMYPMIDAESNPYEYRYTYLLSPASCWADFGKLDIIINTPYEMSESSLQGFEKTERGYRLVRDGLPTNTKGYSDLYFTLLNDGNTPKYEPGSNADIRNNYKTSVLKAIMQSIGSFLARIFRPIFQFIKSIFTSS